MDSLLSFAVGPSSPTTWWFNPTLSGLPTIRESVNSQMKRADALHE